MGVLQKLSSFLTLPPLVLVSAILGDPENFCCRLQDPGAYSGLGNSFATELLLFFSYSF